MRRENERESADTHGILSIPKNLLLHPPLPPLLNPPAAALPRSLLSSISPVSCRRPLSPSRFSVSTAGVAKVVALLPDNLRTKLAPGTQLGPWFYAPALTSFVTPTFFGFLVGESEAEAEAEAEG